MANQSQNDKSILPKLIPVWLLNRWGIACGMIGLYILFYIAWTKFHWGATEAFRLIPSWDVDRNFALISDLAYQPVSLFATIVAWRIARNPAFDLDYAAPGSFWDWLCLHRPSETPPGFILR